MSSHAPVCVVHVVNDPRASIDYSLRFPSREEALAWIAAESIREYSLAAGSPDVAPAAGRVHPRESTYPPPASLSQPQALRRSLAAGLTPAGRLASPPSLEHHPSQGATMSAKPYQIITDRIIQLLEDGVVPWRKPWTSHAAPPQNAVSRRPYRGVNVFLLACSRYDSPYWLTFRQAKQWGGSVNKGEKATPVCFWKWLETEDEETGEIRQRPLLRVYYVFNVAQCDLPSGKLPVTPAEDCHDFVPIEQCEQVVAAMPRRPDLKHDADGAFYRPSEDCVHMPPQERFHSSEEYYATLFHELTHATGHSSRLNRDGIVDPVSFGSPSYSREELVAELGASFLCGHCRIEQATIENSAAYLQGWLKQLRGDARLIVTAAAAAQKASDFILGMSPHQGE
ncbi:MAG: DUF1738 domain-containing protein [Planctomycetales bacterium]|nr:DUF1738 domain-containing protein [Planctomycetales bacterium]